MRESQIRKIQKQRHMSDIMVMILSNGIFKNLNERDRKKLAELIYKAEIVEMHMRDKSLTRVNESFQDIVQALMAMDLDDDEDDEFDDKL
jgi:hypothetical protein